MSYYFPYNDMLNMGYPRVEIEQDFSDSILREAQFAPFAALNGYEEAVRETARLTQRRILPDESKQEELNQKLFFLRKHLKEYPLVFITHFIKDPRKEGGSYQTKAVTIKKILNDEKALLLPNDTKIFIHDILELESDFFPEFWFL